MAKKSQSTQASVAKTKKPNKKRNKRRIQSIDIIALIVFIAIAVAVLVGSIWYYGFHQPRSASEMEEVSTKFTQEYFDVHYDTITGDEGLDWLTANRVQSMKSRSERVNTWKDKSVISRIEGDIEVQILEQSWNSGTTRVIFWQYEEVDGKPGRELLVFYDYKFSYQGGRWLIDQVVTPTPTELESLRRSRGVLDQHKKPQDNGDEDTDD